MASPFRFGGDFLLKTLASVIFEKCPASDHEVPVFRFDGLLPFSRIQRWELVGPMHQGKLGQCPSPNQGTPDSHGLWCLQGVRGKA